MSDESRGSKRILPTFPHSRKYESLQALNESLPRRLKEFADRGCDALAVVDGEVELTRGDLLAAAAAFQVELRSRGFRRGDVLLVQLPNWWETVALTLAVWGLGGVLNLVTPIYRSKELREIVEALRPTVVVVPGVYRGHDHVAMMREVIEELGQSASVIPLRSQGGGDLLPLDRTDVANSVFEATDSLDDVALVMFTSGTTGRAKGVLHSQRTLIYESWSIAERFVRSGVSVFMPSPLGHITGLLFGIVLPILADGRVVLLDRWNPAKAVEQVESHACSFSVGATPFLSGLIKEYSLRGQLSALEWFVCGGADVPSDLVRKAKVAMGTNVARAYGLTEMPTLCCASPSTPLELRESTDGEIIGEADARIGADIGGLDELEVHGPELFLGYLDPRDNERAFTPDGWFRTGDLARINERYVTIVGRAKDVIVRGGENISAKEVEDLIRCMDSVAEVAIVGIADSELGERACAVIVPTERAPALRDVTEHLVASGVAKQKCPEYLIVESSLPVTPSGKVRKFELRDTAAKRLAEEGIVRHDR